MEAMTKEALFEILGSLRKANFAGGGRSPYKPLLLLWILGQLKKNGAAEFSYADLEQDVSHLIDEFSPTSANRYRVEMPFFHLENDLWQISGSEKLEPKRSVLRRANAIGRLQPGVEKLLLSEPGLIEAVARFIVDTHFTVSYLEPIFDVIGLDVEFGGVPGVVISIDQKKRDPKFRDAVLIAWRKQCAMCGYDGEMFNTSVAIEAAHVKWFSQGGPDELENGLALCSLHHKLFDRGVLGIGQEFKIVVADGFIGKSPAADQFVYELQDKSIRDPAPNKPMPSLDFLEWHIKQVFQKKNTV